jgi:hypothetical protein
MSARGGTVGTFSPTAAVTEGSNPASPSRESGFSGIRFLDAAAPREEPGESA